MTGLEYVKHRLHNDFGEFANNIYPHLDSRMDELVEEYPPDEIAEFEYLLSDSIYPFLACLHAMVAAGVEYGFAERYVKKLSEEIPEEVRVEFSNWDQELTLFSTIRREL